MSNQIVFAKVAVKVEEIFNDELEEFGKITSAIYNIDPKDLQALVGSFIVAGVLNEKLILKQKEEEDVPRKYS